MRFETGFIACYALALLAVAAGLHRLGRITASPWASRALAGHVRRVRERQGEPEPVAWPHAEAGRLHTLVAAVAAAAALVLTATELVRRHRPVEAVLLGAVLLLAAAALRWLLSAWRTDRSGG